MDMVRCTECGREFPESDVIRFDDAAVCAECKPLFFQRLREGVAAQGEMVYAGFWIRVGAKIIDGILLSVAGWILGFLGGIIGGMASSIIASVLSSVMGFAYEVYFIGAHGATPGKMVCSLKVVRSDGGKVGYARALGRLFAAFLSGMILGIGYIMVAFDKEKRGLHDRICDTRVIRT